MSNPRSARTVSPGTRLSSSELCSVMYLSLVLPPHPSDMYCPLRCYTNEVFNDAYTMSMSVLWQVNLLGAQGKVQNSR